MSSGVERRSRRLASAVGSKRVAGERTSTYSTVLVANASPDRFVGLISWPGCPPFQIKWSSCAGHLHIDVEAGSSAGLCAVLIGAWPREAGLCLIMLSQGVFFKDYATIR